MKIYKKMAAAVFCFFLWTAPSVPAEETSFSDGTVVGEADIAFEEEDSDGTEADEIDIEEDLDGFMSVREDAQEDAQKDAREDVSGDVYYGGDIGAGGGTGSGSSSNEAVIHKPQLLLEDCSLSGQAIEAGSSVPMTVTLRNQSRTQKIFGLKISLSTQAEGLQFGKNSYYFRNVAPGEAVAMNLTLILSEDAQEGPLPITFSFEYEDDKATSYTGAEALSLNVRQPVKMELDVIDIPSVLFMSDTVTLPVKALNLSHGEVYNVRVRLEGEGLSPREELFLGSLNAQEASEGTLRFYVGQSGTENSDDAPQYGFTTGKVVLTYEDSQGNSYEIFREFQAEVKKAEIVSLKIEEEETNGWWYSIFAVTVSGLAATVLLLGLRLRKKSLLLEEARKGVSP